jgi:hypothetical protein
VLSENCFIFRKPIEVDAREFRVLSEKLLREHKAAGKVRKTKDSDPSQWRIKILFSILYENAINRKFESSSTIGFL